MATVRVYIRKRPSKDGKFPISICITVNRKQVYIMTGQKLDGLDQWDEKNQRVKKSHPNATRLNNFLLSELAKANDKALELETKGHTSAKEVKISLKPIEEVKMYFRHIANQRLAELKAIGDYDAFRSDTTRLKRFYEFVKDEQITFEDITVDLLRRYIVFLKISKKFQYDKDKPPRPLSERSITNHLMIIRTIFNQAINAKLVSKDIYPFGGKGNISLKLTGASKIGLEEAEIKKLEELDLSNQPVILQDARNIWLTEFYFAGMRATDCLLLKWDDFQNGRLYYKMSKNGEWGSVKAPEKALRIIERYRDRAISKGNIHGLIFPYLQDLPSLDDRYELRRRIAFVIHRLNKAMKELMKMIGSTKSATQHKSRHSFAQRAEEKEIHPKVLQKMYRHESILTTMIYQSNFSFKKADEAIDTVLNF
ncbi:MAG: site-specific integrase [Bacteroidetes bacterium]|nr:site-specific integrase [Bacteroidota bacterium]